MWERESVLCFIWEMWYGDKGSGWCSWDAPVQPIGLQIAENTQIRLIWHTPWSYHHSLASVPPFHNVPAPGSSSRPPTYHWWWTGYTWLWLPPEPAPWTCEQTTMVFIIVSCGWFSWFSRCVTLETPWTGNLPGSSFISSQSENTGVAVTSVPSPCVCDQTAG